MARPRTGMSQAGNVVQCDYCYCLFLSFDAVRLRSLLERIGRHLLIILVERQARSIDNHAVHLYISPYWLLNGPDNQTA